MVVECAFGILSSRWWYSVIQVEGTPYKDECEAREFRLYSHCSLHPSQLSHKPIGKSEINLRGVVTQATEKAASVGLDPLSEVPGQARRRKVPEKFKFAATSTTTEHVFPTLQEHYRAKVYYVFVDTDTRASETF
ncbi:unnamed protein product [Leuciscus chuanchicus]